MMEPAESSAIREVAGPSSRRSEATADGVLDPLQARLIEVGSDTPWIPRPGSVSRYLAGCAAGIILLHVLATYVSRVLGYDHALGLVPLFDVNLEGNVPTWFSSALLLMAGLAALAIARADRPNRIQWAAMGAVATLLSIDETAQVHEYAGSILRSALSGVAGSRWIVVLVISGIPTVIAAIFLFRFVRAIPRTTAIGLLAAVGVFVAGAVVVDALVPILSGRIDGWLVGVVSHTVEEMLEMGGAIMLIHVLLSHLLLVRSASAPAGMSRRRRSDR
ncbi:MAG: hypothetical protein ACYC2G_09650 [Gemmatimonadaceae bacterium]